MALAAPPTIALTELSIRDFRGIESLDLDFRGPDGQPNRLVVLAGPNGCGKTAALEAALIAVGGEELAIGPTGRRAIRRGADDLEIQASTQTSRDLESSDFTTHINSEMHSRPRPFPHWYFSSWRAPGFVGGVNITIEESIQDNPIAREFGRKASMFRRAVQSSDMPGRNRLGHIKQQLANAAAARSFADDSQLPHDQYERWMETINSGWNRFHDGSHGKFAVNIAEPSEAGGIGPFEVFFYRENKPRLSVDQLSAGQLELFLFLAALALNDGREGIVFIDEPELHLDPQWHAPIVRVLMEMQPKAQFIVATHSPEIYDAAMSYERHFLVPEDDPRARAWPKIEARAEG